MAVSLKSVVGSVTTTSTPFFTATKQTVIIGGSLANKGAANTTAAAWIQKSGGGIGDIVRNGSVPSGSALIIAGGSVPKITLEVGDKVFAALHSAVVPVDIVISYAEVD